MMGLKWMDRKLERKDDQNDRMDDRAKVRNKNSMIGEKSVGQ